LRSLEDALRAAGAETALPVLSVILPVGISFYTFEAINYMADVYQRRIAAEKSLANLGLFILFFPHLIAGPIVRARDFLPQILRPKRWSWLRAQFGVQLFLLGLFKKLAIADRMALFVDPVFADPEAYRTSALWLAALAYAIQIYCDFSGYSDMALGSAHLLGYKLAQNFNMPFIARNLAEFWRRWHMSLSTWLRDYVYIPLGGNRGGRWQTCRNLLITFTICGLWHGAAWNFVLWGALIGVLLCLHRQWQDWCQRRPMIDGLFRSAPGTLLCIAATFLTFCLIMVIFRAESLASTGIIFGRLFAPCTGLGTPMHSFGLLLTAVLLLAGHVIGSRRWERVMLAHAPAPLVGVACTVMLTLALLLAPDGNRAFVYFQF
jgi:alginate O-acetyltransferase complex protein AlgI